LNLPWKVSAESLKAYDDAELIFAKGMGYAETLIEYQLKEPHFLLFRTKYVSVATYFYLLREEYR
jgi:uncharacterized protein with ATP-grasp and redox domains